MITQTPNQIHFSHIMWQPIFKCESQCKGCYVRASDSSKYNGPLKTDILNLIYSLKKVRCDQLTIALDTMYTVSKELKDTLCSLWRSYRSPEDYYPELYITVNSWNDLIRWQTHLGISTLEGFLDPLTAVSLSNFPSLGKICDELREAAAAAKTTIIYNSLAKEKKKESKQFEMGVRYSDITNVVMFKAPLGQQQELSSLMEVINTVDQVKKIFPKSQIETDRCVLDTEQFIKNGSMCGAGITKVHVWPDGSVSSCPYDSHKKDKNGIFQKEYETLTELTKIRNRERIHPMNFCKIVDLHKKLNETIINRML